MVFYKATSKNTGCGAKFSFDSKRGGNYCVWLNLVKQNGWNPKGNGGKGTGVFKGGKETVVKLSEREIGALIACLFRRTPLRDIENVFYHDTPKKRSIIDLVPYKKDGTQFKGMTFSISLTNKESNEKEKFTLFLTPGEAEALRIYLEYALTHIFDGQRSEDIKKFQDAQAKKNTPKKSESVAKEPPF